MCQLLRQGVHPLPGVTAAPTKALSLFFSRSFIWRAYIVTLVAEDMPQSGRHERVGFLPWVGKMPWRRAWQPIPEFLSRQGSWGGYSP